MSLAQTKQQKRKCGAIRQLPITTPSYLERVSIDNIPLLSQMYSISQLRSQAFEKYEKVVADLQGLVRSLEDQRSYLLSKNIDLHKENAQLRREIESAKKFFQSQAGNLYGLSTNKFYSQLFQKPKTLLQSGPDTYFSKNNHKKVDYLFEIISNEDDFSAQSNQDIEGSMIQCKNGNTKNPHHLVLDMESVLSSQQSIRGSKISLPQRKQNFKNNFIEQPEKPEGVQEEQIQENQNKFFHHNDHQRQTPKKPKKSQQTLIQLNICPNQQNISIFRIFYICMLQSPILMKPLLKHLELLLTTGAEREIMGDKLGENSLWLQILHIFLAMLKDGDFNTQEEVVDYLDRNRVLDIVLVQVLRTMLPEMEPEEEQLFIGNAEEKGNNAATKKMMRADLQILYGLCNCFDLHLQIDRNNRVYKIYQQTAFDESIDSNANTKQNYDEANRNNDAISANSANNENDEGYYQYSQQESMNENNLDIFINNNIKNVKNSDSRVIGSVLSSSEQSNLLLDQSQNNCGYKKQKKAKKPNQNKKQEEEQCVDISLRGPQASKIQPQHLQVLSSFNNNAGGNLVMANPSYHNSNCHAPQPIISICYDHQYTHYRTYITIRPYHTDSCDEYYEEEPNYEYSVGQEEEDGDRSSQQFSANFARTQSQSQEERPQLQQHHHVNVNIHMNANEDGPSQFFSQSSPQKSIRNVTSHRPSLTNNFSCQQLNKNKKGQSCRSSIKNKIKGINNSINSYNILRERDINYVKQFQRQKRQQNFTNFLKKSSSRQQLRKNRYQSGPDEYLISEPCEKNNDFQMQPQYLECSQEDYENQAMPSSFSSSAGKSNNQS